MYSFITRLTCGCPSMSQWVKFGRTTKKTTSCKYCLVVVIVMLLLLLCHGLCNPVPPFLILTGQEDLFSTLDSPKSDYRLICYCVVTFTGQSLQDRRGCTFGFLCNMTRSVSKATRQKEDRLLTERLFGIRSYSNFLDAPQHWMQL